MSIQDLLGKYPEESVLSAHEFCALVNVEAVNPNIAKFREQRYGA